MSFIWIKDRGKIYKLKIPQCLKIVYQPPPKGLSLFANKNFREGEVVISLRGRLIEESKASLEAIQFNKNYFIDTKVYVPEDFINHSCDPKVKLDLNARKFIAIKKIKKNDEITFNYLTTEYDLKKSKADFKCNCGAKNCFRYIKGFKYLSLKQKLKLKPYLSPFLLKKLNEELKRSKSQF